ncbi:hypothetical protein GGX14DRAFT_407144 [Mycena pura]|uniref:Uncharacterized protein n=1 Tax=Mycena pura TaxID=153505 RepID=A0AAD6Y4R6_9AGAR|nr:hypothetical protein GGX14DRAFT_407144 [Mycena pura]
MSRKATPEGRQRYTQVRTGPGVMQGETWLKSDVADRASWPQADARLGKPRMIAQGSDELSECRRCTEEQTQGLQRVYRPIETWYRPNVTEPKSQVGERLGVPRMVTKGSDEVSECRRCIGEKARRRAQPLLRGDRSTDAPERKGGSEVQDDKTPRRFNDADGPGRGVNDHQLRAGKRLGVPSIATGVRGCSRGHRGTAGRPRVKCGSPDRALELLWSRNQVMTSSGGVGPGDDIIDLSRSDSDAIRRARDHWQYLAENVTAGSQALAPADVQAVRDVAAAADAAHGTLPRSWGSFSARRHRCRPRARCGGWFGVEAVACWEYTMHASYLEIVTSTKPGSADQVWEEPAESLPRWELAMRQTLGLFGHREPTPPKAPDWFSRDNGHV